MAWNDHTCISTYRVKPDSREQFLALLRGHWTALRNAGLATDTPALLFEAEVGGDNRHNESGMTFVEVFSWSSPDAARLAHDMPSIMAIWEPMGALVEARNGRPGMEFPNYRPIDPSA